MSLVNLKFDLLNQIDQFFRTHPTLEDGSPYVFRQRFSFWKLLWSIGPGFITVICFIDPGNIEANVQIGSQSGFQLLWCIVLFTIVAYYLNCLALKLGIYQQKSMASVARTYYPKAPRYTLWFFIELACIGVDIQELVGSAIAINLLSNGTIPLYGGVLITTVDVFIILLLDSFNARILESIFFFCLVLMVITFEVLYGKAGISTKDVVKGAVTPYLSKSNVSYALGIAGSYVMPHNLYYQSYVILQRKLEKQNNTEKRDQVRYFAIEQSLAVLITLIINITLTSVFATIFTSNTEDAGLYLTGNRIEEYFGRSYKYIFALGLLAAGQSASMTGTQAGQIIMEGFLDIRVTKWVRASITRAVALVPAIIIAVVLERIPGALDQLSQYVNFIQAIFLPFAAIPLLDLTSNANLMGDLVNTGFTIGSLFIIITGLTAVNLFGIISEFEQWFLQTRWAWGIMGPLIAIYLAFLIYLVINPYRFNRMTNFIRVNIFKMRPHRLQTDYQQDIAAPRMLTEQTSLIVPQQEIEIQRQSN